MTMVVVTHEIGFAKEVATDVVFIDEVLSKKRTIRRSSSIIRRTTV